MSKIAEEQEKKSMTRNIKVGTLISVDSDEFIAGMSGAYLPSATLMERLELFVVRILHLVEREVVRNLAFLNRALLREFYSFILHLPDFKVIYEPVPDQYVKKQRALGLSKEDSIIAGFTEWIGAKFLVTENRHFLKGYHSRSFEILDSKEFLKRLEIKSD